MAGACGPVWKSAQRPDLTTRCLELGLHSEHLAENQGPATKF